MKRSPDVVGAAETEYGCACHHRSRGEGAHVEVLAARDAQAPQAGTGHVHGGDAIGLPRDGGHVEASGERAEQVSEARRDDDRERDDGQQAPPPEGKGVGREVGTEGQLVAESEKDRQVAGQVDEVPRLVWDPLAQPPPGGEPDDEHEHGAGGCRDHPGLMGEQIDEPRDDRAAGRGTPRPGIGHGVNQEGQHGRDAEPAMGRQQRVLAVAPLDEARPRRQHEPTQGSQGGDQPEELPESGQGADPTGQQTAHATVLDPDTEGHGDDEASNRQQVTRAGAGVAGAGQPTNGGTHGLLPPGLLEVGSAGIGDGHVTTVAHRAGEHGRTVPA